MSDGEERKYLPFPKTPTGKIDRPKLRRQYFASEAVEWVTFCREKGYNWREGGGKLHRDFEEWKREKKKFILEEHHQDLREKLDKRKGKWNSEVLDALTEAPELAAFAMRVVKGYWNEMAREMAKDLKRRANGEVIPDKEAFYRKFSPGQVASLSVATSSLIDSRYKSLLLDQWHIKTAEALADKAPEALGGGTESKGLVFELSGSDGEKLSEEQLVTYFSSYIDKPAVVETTGHPAGGDDEGPQDQA